MRSARASAGRDVVLDGGVAGHEHVRAERSPEQAGAGVCLGRSQGRMDERGRSARGKAVRAHEPATGKEPGRTVCRSPNTQFRAAAFYDQYEITL